MIQGMETEPDIKPKLEVLREFIIVDRGKPANNPPQLAAISPDGYYMVYFAKQNSYVVNSKGKTIFEVQSEFQSFQFSGDSQIIAVLYEHKKVFKIVIYNLKSSKILKEHFFDHIKDIGKHSILFQGQGCFFFTESHLQYFDCQANNSCALIQFHQNPRKDYSPFTMTSIIKNIVLARITFDQDYQTQYLIYLFQSNNYPRYRLLKMSVVKRNIQVLRLDNNLLLEGPKIKLTLGSNNKIVRKVEQKFIDPARVILINYHLYYFYQLHYYKVNLLTANITEHQFFIPPVFGDPKGDYTIQIHPVLVEQVEIRRNNNKRINNIIAYQFKD